MTEIGRKWRFDIIASNGVQEPYTGLFRNREEADRWFEKHGKFHMSQGRNLLLIESQSPEEVSEQSIKIGNC